MFIASDQQGASSNYHIVALELERRLAIHDHRLGRGVGAPSVATQMAVVYVKDGVGAQAARVSCLESNVGR